MRIAFITPEFVTEDYYSGGLANYLHRITIILTQWGHEVHVITQSTMPDDSFQHGSVWVHRLHIQPRSRWARIIFRRFLYDATQWTAFAFRAWRKLEALNQTTPIDIVQLANYRACGLCVAAFSRIPHVTRLSSLQYAWHEASNIQRHPGHLAVEWLEWLQLRFCRYLYAPSQLIATLWERKSPNQSVTVLRSPAFVETEQWDTQPYQQQLANRHYLLFVGRFEPLKGIDILAKALPKILAIQPDLEAVFIGRDTHNAQGVSMKEMLCQTCENYKSRLHFFEQMPHQQLYPIIAGAKLMILPSQIDNLPNIMLEAMTFACPVIGTVGASFDELIDDQVSGFLIPPNDPEALADTVLMAWNHPRRQAIGKAGQQVVKQLEPEIVVGKLVEYYYQMLAMRK